MGSVQTKKSDAWDYEEALFAAWCGSQELLVKGVFIDGVLR